MQNYRMEFPSVSWQLSPKYLSEMLDHPKTSSPGPDGIPFVAYSKVRDIAHKVIWNCAKHIYQGGQPPSDFNLASLVLLAKKPSVEVDFWQQRRQKLARGMEPARMLQHDGKTG